MRRQIWVAAPLSVVALLVTSGVAWAAFSWLVKGQATVTTAPNHKPVITVAGSVRDLVPGAIVPLHLEAQNRNPYPIQITDLRGHSLKTPSGCQDHAVALVKKSPAELAALVVPARGRLDLRAKVTMKEWAGRRCAGQDLTLEFEVRARQAR